MEVKASLNKYRKSAKKTRDIVSVLRNMNVIEAGFQLENMAKGYAGDLKKLLASAVANAKNNYNLKEDDLVIEDIIIDEKPVMKRWMPRAHGSAAQILKRTCRIEIVLKETPEAVKTRETASKKKIEQVKDIKNHKKNQGVVEIEDKKEETDASAVGKKDKKSARSEVGRKFIKMPKLGGQAKKIFRRKSI